MYNEIGFINFFKKFFKILNIYLKNVNSLYIQFSNVSYVIYNNPPPFFSFYLYNTNPNLK